MGATLILDEAAVFVRVVERGSFSAAARELGVPTSTVSRQVQRLEDALGVSLVTRSTRSLSLTDAGAEYHRQIAPAIVAVREAGELVRGQAVEPSGHLRLTAIVDLSDWLGPLIVEFAKRYPKISVEVIATNRVVDLVAEGLDCAIRAGPMRDSTMIATKLIGADAWLVASKSYLDRAGRPRRIEQLTKHDCVLFRAKSQATWSLIGPSGTVEVEVSGRLAFDDMSLMRAAVIAGAGIGFLPSLSLNEDFQKGVLERVLPRYQGKKAGLQFVYPHAQHLPRKLTAFRDFLLTQRDSFPHA